MSNSTQFPTVYIQPLALAKLQLYCKHAGHNEISGLGIARADEGELVVEDVFIFEQEVTGADTELNADALAKWDYEIRKNDGDPSLYRLWWHKHPISGWSTTDDKNIEGMKNGQWLLSIVHTPNGFLCRLDIYQPFRVTMDSLELMELSAPNYELDKAIKEEVASKVKTKSYAVSTWTPSPNSPWMNDGKGGWFRKGDEKKEQSIIVSNYAKGENATSPNAEHDAFFEAMADHDWESYYNWNSRDPGEGIRERLYGRGRI